MNAPLPPLPPRPSPLERARELVAEGREAEAATLLEAHPGPATAALHREITLRAATRALDAREIAAATAWLDRGLARNPDDTDLNFFRGNLHHDSGHSAAATACYRRCLAAAPGRQEFVCALANALLAAHQPAEPVLLLQALPPSAQTQLLLGAAHEQLGDSAAAAHAYERAAHLRPDRADTWLALGSVRERLADLPGALAACNRAVALNPASARAHLARARLFARLQKLPDALACCERSLACDPTGREALQLLTALRRQTAPSAAAK